MAAHKSGASGEAEQAGEPVAVSTPLARAAAANGVKRQTPFSKLCFHRQIPH